MHMRIDSGMRIVAGARPRVAFMLGLSVAALTGCDDVLTVDDPQRYTSDDLDASLDAVINGVEGDFYIAIPGLVNATSLASDEAQHTGTWIGYDELDHGRFFYSNANGGGGLGSGDDIMEALLRSRHFAQSAQERFTRVLEGEAASSPYMARAQVVEGWTNLLLAQNFCEAPAEAGGPAVSDAEMLQVAISTLTTALQTAQAAGEQDVALFAQAGRARAHLLAGSYQEALSDARAIPTDFVWEAQFSANSGRQENDIVNLSTAGFNRASGVREFYWPRVDTEADAMRDPYSDEIDARVAVLFDGGIGVDGLTPHYSQWKYRDLGSNIELTDGAEMRLIEAEVLWRQNDLDGAMELLDQVRAAAALSPRPATNDPNQVFDYLIHERFAELYWEGQRMADLHRFELVDDFIAEGRFGAETENPRPTKFPIAEDEVINSSAFPDKGISGRCLPMSG